MYQFSHKKPYVHTILMESLGNVVDGWEIGIISGVIAGFGTAVLIGIAGAVAIYYLGEFLDGIWESFKEQIFG